MFAVVSTQNSLFIYYLLIIVLFSIQTTVPLLLPHPIVFLTFIPTKNHLRMNGYFTFHLFLKINLTAIVLKAHNHRSAKSFQC